MSTTAAPIFSTANDMARIQDAADAARAALHQLHETLHREQQHRARVIDAVRTFNARRVLRLLEGGPDDDGYNRDGVPAPKRFDLGYQEPTLNLWDALGTPEELQQVRASAPAVSVDRPELDGLLVELVDALASLNPTDGRLNGSTVPRVLDTAHLLLAIGCRDRMVDGVPLRDVLHNAWKFKHGKGDATAIEAVLDRWLKPPRRNRATSTTNPGA